VCACLRALLGMVRNTVKMSDSK